MGIVESVSKKFSFLDKNWLENVFGKNYYSTPIDWVMFRRLVQKY